MLLYLLREINQHGCYEDESNYTTTSERLFAFENDDQASEGLLPYYESQDCDYQVKAIRLCNIPDRMLDDLEGSIKSYREFLKTPHCSSCGRPSCENELSDYDGLCVQCYRDRARSRGELLD
jgi:hypothetical protein